MAISPNRKIKKLLENLHLPNQSLKTQICGVKMNGSDLQLTMAYECEGTLEHNILRKIVIDNLISIIKRDNLSLQHSGSIIIENLSPLELLEHLKDFGHISSTGNDTCIIVKDDACILLHFNNREMYKVVLYSIFSSSVEKIKQTEEQLKSVFSSIEKDLFSVNIRWYYIRGSGSDYTYITEVISDIIYPEAYPYIENLDEFIDGYINGSEQVLILIGPTGTGKTRFIRYIIKKLVDRKKDLEKRKDLVSSSHDDGLTVSYTTDMKVLEKETIFIDLLSEDIAALIIEDIDFHLKSRKEGNTFMYKLLAASDGLITNINRKIIVSTNLKNVNDIDDALLRPGRCFSIIDTRNLTQEEAYKLIHKLLPINGILPKLTKSSYSVAEIYKLIKGDNINRETRQTKKLGF